MRAIFAAGMVLAACDAGNAPLISGEKIVGDAIPLPLVDGGGDLDRGETLFAAREAGHCVLCHVVSGLDAEFQGTIGPDLTSVGDRLSLGQIRLRIVDYELVRPGTLMPSYYRTHDLYQVEAQYRDTPILSAQDIEDIVAYLGQRKVSPDDA